MVDESIWVRNEKRIGNGTKCGRQKAGLPQRTQPVPYTGMKRPSPDRRFVSSSVVLTLTGLLTFGCMPVLESEEQDVRPAERPGEVAPRVAAGAVTVQALTEDGLIAINDYRGRVVLLDFWATWSAPSRHELPRLARLHEELEQDGFSVIGLCLDTGTMEDVRRRVEAFDLPYPVGWADEAVTKAYGGIRAVPTKILLDRQGRIGKTYPGVEPVESLRADIKALLGE